MDTIKNLQNEIAKKHEELANLQRELKQAQENTPKYNIWEIGATPGTRHLVSSLTYSERYKNLTREEADIVVRQFGENKYWQYVAIPTNMKIERK